MDIAPEHRGPCAGDLLDRSSTHHFGASSCPLFQHVEAITRRTVFRFFLCDLVPLIKPLVECWPICQLLVAVHVTRPDVRAQHDYFWRASIHLAQETTLQRLSDVVCLFGEQI